MTNATITASLWLAVLVALLTPSTTALSSSDIMGTWQVPNIDNGCRLDIFFESKVYVAYRTNCGANNALWAGTYSLSGSTMLIEYAHTTEPSFTSVQVVVTVGVSGGTMSFVETSSPALFSLTLQKITDPSYAGVWTGSGDDGSIFTAQFIGDMYLAYSNVHGNGVYEAYFGGLVDGPTVGTKNISYAYAAQSSGLHGSNLEVNFTSSPSQVVLSRNAPNSHAFVTTFDDLQAVSPIEGVWTTIDYDCVMTVQIDGPVYRAYRTSCTDPNNRGVWQGTLELNNDNTNMTVNYAYSNEVSIMGTSRDFNITLNNAAGTLRIQRTLDDIDMTLVKVDFPPTLARATITVAVDYAAFSSNQTAIDAFKQALATAAGVPVTSIVIVDIAAGSTVIDVLITTPQDPNESTSAGAALETLEQTSIVGGLALSSVEEVSTSAASTTATCSSVLAAALLLAGLLLF